MRNENELDILFNHVDSPYFPNILFFSPYLAYTGYLNWAKVEGSGGTVDWRFMICTLRGVYALTERLWQYHPKWKQPKWKFSTFCGLPGTTSYPYLPLRTIDPPDTRSHPQGGVQIYPQPNHLSKKGKKKYIPPNSDFS